MKPIQITKTQKGLIPIGSMGRGRIFTYMKTYKKSTVDKYTLDPMGFRW